MRFTHTNRHGFWIGFFDFFTAGFFLLFCMPLGRLQDEIETVPGHPVMLNRTEIELNKRS